MQQRAAQAVSLLMKRRPRCERNETKREEKGSEKSEERYRERESPSLTHTHADRESAGK